LAARAGSVMLVVAIREGGRKMTNLATTLVRCFANGEVSEQTLGRWDLLKLPVGLQHEPHNTSEVDCQLQTLLSAPQPRRPRYSDPELLALHAAATQPVLV
jgi:hypothetical protein